MVTLQNDPLVDYVEELMFCERQSKDEIKFIAVRRCFFLGLTLLITWAGGVSAQPLDFETSLLRAQELTLFSLEPEFTTEPGFHGYKVLGQRKFIGASASSLTRALTHSLRESTEGNRFACFVPRHGIRVGGYDLVICFECETSKLYDGAGNIWTLPTSARAGPFFRTAVRVAGLPWPGWDDDGDSYVHVNGWRVACRELQGEVSLGNSWLELRLDDESEIRLLSVVSEQAAEEELRRLKRRGSRLALDFNPMDTDGLSEGETPPGVVTTLAAIDQQDLRPTRVTIGYLTMDRGWLVYQTRQRCENLSRTSLWSRVSLSREIFP